MNLQSGNHSKDGNGNRSRNKIYQPFWMHLRLYRLRFLVLDVFQNYRVYMLPSSNDDNKKVSNFCHHLPKIAFKVEGAKRPPDIYDDVRQV